MSSKEDGEIYYKKTLLKFENAEHSTEWRKHSRVQNLCIIYTELILSTQENQLQK